VKIALDGYALRFPRTGIVNCSYAIAQAYRQRLAGKKDLKILLGDRSVTDSEIDAFLAESHAVPILDIHKESFFERVCRKARKNPFFDYMPGLNVAIQQSTRGYDVFHCMDWFMHPSRKTRLNVMTYFDLTTTIHPEFHEELNIAKEKRKLELATKFDLIFCISQSTKNDLLAHSQVNPDKLIVNHIGADELFDADSYKPRDEIARKYGIPEGFKYLLSVSTIEPRKNFKMALEVFAGFLGRHPGEPYVLVCSGMWGWKNNELSDYLASCGLTDSVIFTGYADKVDLPSLYYHAECFLYLSLYEGFGLPVLEAMKSRCPVVSSNTSSMPEVVGEAGLLVPPNDLQAVIQAIETVVFDDSVASGMRERGFERGKQFSWNNHVNTLFRYYDMLI
jgi:glycosyltransferase involved in cell wall biosynthesis